uniref:Uncharacterized protein MANES_10G031800 n=1 Tax=Rhizophora mucronata TaxID=61149 RepID=A0A2P2KN44_RHIMU
MSHGSFQAKGGGLRSDDSGTLISGGRERVTD